MTTPPRLIAFDWDGTLMDSVARIVGCLRLAASELGLPDRDDAVFGDVIGLGLPQAILRLYADLDLQRVEHFRDRYAFHFIAAETVPSPLFPGAIETVRELRRRGYLVAIATGKSRRGLERALGASGVRDDFDASRCADETASKPDPRMLRELLQEFRVEAPFGVMVGDTEYDLDMANRAGMRAIGVSYGVHGRDRLALHRPDCILDSLSELLDLFPGSGTQHRCAELAQELDQADQR